MALSYVEETGQAVEENKKEWQELIATSSVTGIRECGAEINTVAVYSAFSLQWLSFMVQS